ncbi:Regulator of nonsense transcripts 1-like protein [Sarracenia purpurea var. burkii]
MDNFSNVDLSLALQASQSGYAVDYVTQGAQAGFLGSFLNQNSQAGYSRFCTGNDFMSQDYMAHGSQEDSRGYRRNTAGKMGPKSMAKKGTYTAIA